MRCHHEELYSERQIIMNSHINIHTLELNGETVTVFSSRVNKETRRKHWLALMRAMKLALEEGILEDAVPDSVLTDSINYEGCDWAVLEMSETSSTTFSALVVPVVPGALPVRFDVDKNSPYSQDFASYSVEM